jgi:hypothetical protein
VSLLTALALLAGTSAASPVAPPRGWIEVAPPKTDSEWQCANYSLPERAISGGLGSPLQIREFEDQGQPDRRVELADGTLTGSNHGEWGGKIEWLAKGQRERVLVEAANTQALFARKDEVFALVGLAHLGTDEGALLRLRRDGKAWRAEKLLDLGSAPQAAYRIDADRVLVATTGGLQLLDLAHSSLERLHRNPGWGSVYPNSVRPFGDGIALGVRGAVVVLRREGQAYSEHWWLPAECRKPGNDCACANPAMKQYIER